MVVERASLVSMGPCRATCPAIRRALAQGRTDYRQSQRVVTDGSKRLVDANHICGQKCILISCGLLLVIFIAALLPSLKAAYVW
jgi:hypothetical protein